MKKQFKTISAKLTLEEYALVNEYCTKRDISTYQFTKQLVMREILADDAFKDQDPLMDYLHETHPNIIRDDTQKRLMRIQTATPFLFLELMKLMTDDAEKSREMLKKGLRQAEKKMEEWGYDYEHN